MSDLTNLNSLYKMFPIHLNFDNAYFEEPDGTEVSLSPGEEVYDTLIKN